MSYPQPTFGGADLPFPSTAPGQNNNNNATPELQFYTSTNSYDANAQFPSSASNVASASPTAWNLPPSSSSQNIGGSISYSSDNSTNPYENEPPLLEELGINPRAIWKRTLAVSIPFRPITSASAANPNASSDDNDADDADLAGPLCFCLLLGCVLLLSGKIHFGYIYGFGVCGCLCLYCILNCMSDVPISVDRTISILGYALLPLCLLACCAIILDLRSGFGLFLSALAIAWCTTNATRMFEYALQLKNQRWLVAYPVTMLYAVFALLTVF